MTNQFIPLALDPGQIIVQQAIDDNCKKYAIKVERGADCAAESVVTIRYRYARRCCVAILTGWRLTSL